MAMPAGIVRVYQSDTRGGVHFVGEDRIGHTPKDEVVNLRIGRAFDVVAERKQIDFEKIATNVYEVEYEVVLRNHKATPITVEVNEPVGGTWRVLRSTHPVHEDRRLCGAVHDPVSPRWIDASELSGEGDVLRVPRSKVPGFQGSWFRVLGSACRGPGSGGPVNQEREPWNQEPWNGERHCSRCTIPPWFAARKLSQR